MVGVVSRHLREEVDRDPMTSKAHPGPGPKAAQAHYGARVSDGASLYTPEERARRDSSVWTIVQGVLAPVQFVIFAISLVLVLRTLATGEGAFAADVSIIAKTLALYAIMITGSIWEKVVFGKWLFARPFFWEDVFSMVVIGLHTAYLVMLLGGFGSVESRLLVALAGYAAYIVNAGQFLLKLRAARLAGTAQAVPA